MVFSLGRKRFDLSGHDLGSLDLDSLDLTPLDRTSLDLTLLDLTLPTAAENLALDEALLDEAEAAGGSQELLRLWEPQQTLVVVGRGSQLAHEVDLAACRRDGVPVLRRSSGGAAIVSGRGCLMYAVVLSQTLRPELRSIDAPLRAGDLGERIATVFGRHCATRH
jgi:lipoate-protein ligase A